jgi:predicted molibdopterin-dependent oxidoreductase YjgC
VRPIHRKIIPADAKELGVSNCETVLFKSGPGDVRVKARVTDKSSHDVAFMFSHFIRMYSIGHRLRIGLNSLADF